MGNVVLNTSKAILERIIAFLPKLGAVILVLILGWIIAKIIEKVIVKVLKILKLDYLSEKLEINKFLLKGGIKFTLSEIIGIIIYWILLLIVFVSALNILGLNVVAGLLNQFVLYIPKIIASLFILILGGFVATVIASVVRTTCNNFGIKNANLLGNTSKIVILVFTVLIALEQLSIKTEIINFAVNIILASLGLGVAIAIGLGAKDIVKDYLEKKLK